jgi:16S rRNA (uracil1498-N3)-methyltransferase
MRLHRFYISPEITGEILVGNSIETSEEELVHQLKDVFRFEVGNRFVIFNGSGVEAEVEIKAINKKLVSFEISKTIDGLMQNVELPRQVTLAFALLKGEHTEMVLEKCTELGVTTFQPLITDRTIKTGFRKNRLEKIITEATEQSGWCALPTLCEPTSLVSFLKSQTDVQNIFVMDIGGDKITPLSSWRGAGGEVVTILIGPEGGWSDEERKLFKDLDLKIFSFGKQTLRAETTCIASVANLI